MLYYCVFFFKLNEKEKLVAGKICSDKMIGSRILIREFKKEKMKNLRIQSGEERINRVWN